MKLSLLFALPGDAAAIAALKNEAALQLTSLYGKGHWSNQCTEKGVLYGMKGNTKVLTAKHNNIIVGTLALITRKPLSINVDYFTKTEHPLYLVDMAVHPAWQRKGIGKYMIENINPLVTAWPAQALRLDAYDNAAGAGGFYKKCGFTEKGRMLYKNNPLIYFEMLFE